MIRRDKTDPNTPTTYHALAQGGLELESGGRFAVDAAIVGRDPAPYPAQPAGSPWAGAQPVEPPTGLAIDAQEPTGEPHELAASLERLERLAREAE
jgi:hypothetical protein